MTRLYALLVVLAFLLGAIGVQTVRLAHVEAALAAEKADRAEDGRRATLAALVVSENYRDEEARRTQSLQESSNEAQRLASRARDDGARADAASVGLRDAFRAAATADHRSAASDPTAPGISPTATSTGLVLTDVFGGADDTAGELAKALDAAYIAGTECARDYDAMTPNLRDRP
jgi:hypothetical protein